MHAWVPGRWDAEQENRRSGDGRLVLVAAGESDRVVAFIDLEPDGHIDRLFCAPEAAGKGVASRLYDAAEAAAREQGIERLFTEASELARRFFERKGFAVLERQDMILRGVPAEVREVGVSLSTAVRGQPVPSAGLDDVSGLRRWWPRCNGG